MTILVMGTIKLGEGEGAKAAKMLADHVATVLTEEGCEEYSFAFDAADPDLVRVAERWSSPEALAAHGQADHQKAFGRALRAHAPASMKIDAWDGQHSRNLIGG
ncbi:antibiotic biosynthesis monooxygenase [Sphingomonas sp. RHCKR47]|uniref:putative quinol monooxygenase n=1 Tax=Sphingomonas citricola TaxID=2862498 RepID=UPI001CA57A28|nr:antibiotic biosynthesis monooxygenase [Sphingomonas citricola]MBW6522920.1 antibiotic biosynthesis monooxygenase [Sphingomonas citricola]